jgi:hypothetical protein
MSMRKRSDQPSWLHFVGVHVEFADGKRTYRAMPEALVHSYVTRTEEERPIRQVLVSYETLIENGRFVQPPTEMPLRGGRP